MNKTKKNLLGTLIAFLIVSNLYLFHKLDNLETNIQRNNEDIINNLSLLRQDTDNISVNVDAKLKKQASIFDSIAVKHGEMNTQSYTVPLHIEATPKTISDGAKAELILKGSPLLMTQNDTSFVLDTQISAFESFRPEDAKIIITDGAKKTTESLDMSSYYDMSQIILQANGGFEGNSSYGNNTYSRDGVIAIGFFSNANNYVEDIQYVRELNGKVLDKKSLENTKHNEDVHMDIKDSFTLLAKGKFIDYLLITDHYGLVYKYVTSVVIIDANGGLNGEEQGRSTMTEIYDKKGNVLWNGSM